MTIGYSFAKIRLLFVNSSELFVTISCYYKAHFFNLIKFSKSEIFLRLYYLCSFTITNSFYLQICKKTTRFLQNTHSWKNSNVNKALWDNFNWKDIYLSQSPPPHSYGLLIKVENYNIFFLNLLDSPGPLPDIGLSTF